MPYYNFECKKCETKWEEFTSYDPKNIYPKVKCTKCGSKKKNKLISDFSIGGPTSSKMDSFSYRAGFNMEKAKGERRAAEAATGGASPYRDMSGDFNLGEGIHDPETRLGLS